jgi:acylphosphatase
MSDITRRLVIRGRVQRVGYRAFVEQMALELGVQGWVRNRADGSVEALVVGPAEVIEDMIEACRQGPTAARVDAVDQREGRSNEVAMRRSGELFSVLPTL